MKCIHLVLILSLIFSSCLEPKKTREEVRKEKLESVREHTFEGRIISSVYGTDSTFYMKDNSTAGAAAGATGAALVGFGPLGMIVGAAIGADAGKTKKGVVVEEKLVLIVESTSSDTFYFEIFPPRYPTPRRFSQPSIPSRLQIFLASKPGKRIRIPSSSKLSKFAHIESWYVYFDDQKIPEID